MWIVSAENLDGFFGGSAVVVEKGLGHFLLEPVTSFLALCIDSFLKKLDSTSFVFSSHVSKFVFQFHLTSRV